MSDELLARIASASLSRVDCGVCGGRLYTDHKPGCPVPAWNEKRLDELVALMTSLREDGMTEGMMPEDDRDDVESPQEEHWKVRHFEGFAAWMFGVGFVGGIAVGYAAGWLGGRWP